MSTIRFSTIRDLLVSAAGSLVFSAMIIAAAVLPAQTATAAVFRF